MILERAGALGRRLSSALSRGRRAVAVWHEGRRAPVLVELVEEEPAKPARRRLYVSVRAEMPAVGWLCCPCGCGDVISLRLAGERRPRWSLASLSGAATLYPSVWRQARCQSHFILRDGRVQWC